MLTFTRFFLAFSCFFASSVAILRSFSIPLTWKLHLYFIAFWSSVFGVGMIALASRTEILGGVFLSSLNVASICTMFGFSTFMLRHEIMSRKLMRKINIFKVRDKDYAKFHFAIESEEDRVQKAGESE